MDNSVEKSIELIHIHSCGNPRVQNPFPLFLAAPCCSLLVLAVSFVHRSSFIIPHSSFLVFPCSLIFFAGPCCSFCSSSIVPCSLALVHCSSFCLVPCFSLLVLALSFVHRSSFIAGTTARGSSGGAEPPSAILEPPCNSSRSEEFQRGGIMGWVNPPPPKPRGQDKAALPLDYLMYLST